MSSDVIFDAHQQLEMVREKVRTDETSERVILKI